MTEIKPTQPLPPAPAVRQAVAAADLALKLLQPMQGLLAEGESADAQILSVRQAQQDFQLTLRLTLGSGRQATLEASSPKSVAPGAAFSVTALPDGRLGAALLPPGQQPLGRLNLEALPAGTIIQGRVTATQQPQQSGMPFKVVLTLLDSPLAGQKLSVESSTPLAAGSLVTAQVQGSQSLVLLPLSGRLDQLGLAQQLAAQQARQGSLEALLGALQRSTGSGPEELRGAAQRLLGLITPMQLLGDPKLLAQALANSGLFLERQLLAGQTEHLPTDIKAALLRLVAQLPGLPGSTLLAAAQASAAGMAQALPAFARQALGALGQSGGRQLALQFPLPARLLANLDGEGDLENLLKLAAAAISRLQTHQLSSLAQSQSSPDGSQVTTWQIELPMRDQQAIVPLQVKLQREDPPPQNAQAKPESLWKVELAFDVAPLGPLQVQAQLVRGSLSSHIWAERSATAELISAELEHFRERLVGAGLTVGELGCRQGVPPQGPRTSLEQRFVDETA